MKTETLLIRAASDADFPAITAIYRDHVLHGSATFELDPPDEREMRARRDKVHAAGCPYLVALEGDRLIGYAYAGPFHPRPAYRLTIENSIYLDPSAMGKGVGEALMRHLIDACEKRGFRQMIALISRLDPPVSIKLHEKLGFRHAGLLETTGYKNGHWLDVVYMQLTLGAGATLPPE